MSLLGRIFDGDEELGKKDDDHRPSDGTASSSRWATRKSAPWLRKRRIFYGLGALLLLYVFIKNIPTDLGPVARFADLRVNEEDDQGNRGGKLPAVTAEPPTNKPKRPATPSEVEEHYHDGPIKFYKLATSLHSAARLGGQHDKNKNVLFAASNLKCASEIIPLACEMARWGRNDVHFAIMGRDEMEIQEIKKLNGADEECSIHWHDARPDYSRWSSDFRMEVSVAASMDHFQTFLHPQVVIVDDSSKEDYFFVDSLRSKAMDIGKPIIELPSDAVENMMWITRLDSGSLAAWTTTYVDVLIQAPSDSSGTLVRLLKSIEDADYFGIRRPHLTIELPAEVDPPTSRYLDNLIWPPLDWSGIPHASQVSLRHRIQRRTSTQEEASARLVESFYPVRTGESHVLLLSPQVELSPIYYHYLMYHLLEYKYSVYVQATKEPSNLMGISLELPSFHLNDSAPFEPPSKEKPKTRQEGVREEVTPFLWQAPNANAALYFGDKWIEFHSFLTARLSKPPSDHRKIFSEKHPSWLEYLLELMRARGYSLLYPNFPELEDESIATVHGELYQIPEEFSKPKSSSPTSPPPPLNPEDPLTTDYDKGNRKTPPNSESSVLTSSLVSLLPNSGDLPALSNLPLLSYSGEKLTYQESGSAGYTFSETFRHETGACRSSEEVTSRKDRSAFDLFCHLDEIYDPLAARQRNTHSYSVNHKEPEEEDVIAAEHHENAKEENAAHLARQGGNAGGTKRPGPLVQEDNSAETQGEFKAQMERQARQAASTGPEGAEANDVERPKTEEPKANEPKPDVPKEDLPKNDVFKKQEPPKAVEDPKAEAAKEKGAGW